MESGEVPTDPVSEVPTNGGDAGPATRADGEGVQRPYHGVWAVNAEGDMTGPGGITATDEERDAFIRRIEAKIEAGTVSMIERRCLAAARHSRGRTRDA